jgi:Tol biopolymer transport system component
MFINKESGQTMVAPLINLQGKPESLDWSPNGDFLLILTKGQSGFILWAQRLDGSELIKIVEAISIQSPEWSPTGDAIYYLQEWEQAKALMKLPMQPGSLVKAGDPMILLPGLKLYKNTLFSTSDDASRLIYVQQLSWSNLWLFEPTQKTGSKDNNIRQLTSGTSFISCPAISPDGKQVAFSMSTGKDTHIYTMPIDGGKKRQLTYTGRMNISPAWSSDGSQIAYKSRENGTFLLSIIDATGGEPSIIHDSEVSRYQLFKIVWSPGEQILYYAPDRGGIHILNPQTGVKKPLEINGSADMIDATVSPGGSQIAAYWRGFARGTGRTEENNQGIWNISLKDSSRILIAGGNSPSTLGWSSDGQWVYFMEWESKTICRVPAMGGDVDTVATIPFENVDWVDMSSDGSQFICQNLEAKSDVLMVKDFDPDID